MSDKDKLRELADQLICHPVSRSIDETEEAGEAIKCLLDELKSLQAENDRMASELARPVSSEVSTLLAERSKLIWENEHIKAENEALRKDAERIDWLTGTLFVGKWNGVIGGGNKVTWTIPGDWRHTCATMVGNDLRTAIDAAMRAADAAMKGTP